MQCGDVDPSTVWFTAVCCGVGSSVRFSLLATDCFLPLGNFSHNISLLIGNPNFFDKVTFGEIGIPDE